MSIRTYLQQKSLPVLSLGFMIALGLMPQQGRAQTKTEPAKEEPKKASGGIKTFKEFFTTRPLSDTGLFIVHRYNDSYYFEIPDSLLRRDMLIVSRRSAMSSSEIDPMVVGDAAQPGTMVQWDKSPDGKSIFLRKVTTRNLMRFSGKDAAFQQAVALQTLDPIILALPIKATGTDSNAIIDIKPLYLADVKELTPFAKSPILQLLGLPDNKKYKLADDRSYISSTQSFRKNVEVLSLLTFTEGDHTYTIEMNRSMVLLPDVPMRPRFADERVGYFTTSFTEFNENYPVEQRYIANRWRLEPRPEDRARMEKGELVEPQSPIVLYIDAATPLKWRQYIRQGIEDWLPAFEAAGFKNAIRARDMPVGDPDFNPEDVRYSVIRYTASNIPNAKGPSVTDPRSGEILESDIIIYHNVLQLLRDWRFAQTAANDPAVRTLQMPDAILGEALRYVVAHEVGHALGLRHNMGASHALPTDSLRSATFTHKYGTTPSIMDYARNNYVAQPGDKGVKLTPPLLGAYDKYAISWGYKPIASAKDPKDEVPVLNRWIAKHADDPRYLFAEGDWNGSDPTAQRESLGDDVVKASRYGVNNTKYIVSHLQDWLGKPGEKYNELEDYYQAALRQYERYMGHVGTLVGGMEQRHPMQGQKGSGFTYASKKEQREAVAFLLQQYRELPQWLSDKNRPFHLVATANSVRRVLPASSYIERLYESSLRVHILNNGKLAYLIDNELINGASAYTIADLFNDLRHGIFPETAPAKIPLYFHQTLQSMYVDRLTGIARAARGSVTKSSSLALQAPAAIYCFDWNDRELPSQKEAVSVEAEQLPAATDLYFQALDFRATDKQHQVESEVLAELNRLKQLVERRRVGAKGETAEHYTYLLKKINRFLEDK
jgi:hypothetical protein